MTMTMDQPRYPIEAMPPVMNDEECAGVLRCKVPTVVGLVKTKQLNSIKIGLERRFRAADVIAFIEDRAENRINHKGGNPRGLSR